jgi:hypothetical protein
MLHSKNNDLHKVTVNVHSPQFNSEAISSYLLTYLLLGLSLQANYTDRATAASRRS